jgi:REP element-mobilizing transposase RayT
MDRYWLLTWTTYATWLPGDARGFVSIVVGEDGKGVRHNTPGTPCDADHPNLQRYARQTLKGQPIYLIAEQAFALLAQFQETACCRQWLLQAVSIMANHIHIVLGVPGDPEPETLLRDLKSYGSWGLNRRWGKPASATWWTESGSKRKLENESAVPAAVQYVKDQEYPLLIWTLEEGLVFPAQASGGRQPPVGIQPTGG